MVEDNPVIKRLQEKFSQVIPAKKMDEGAMATLRSKLEAIQKNRKGVIGEKLSEDAVSSFTKALMESGIHPINLKDKILDSDGDSHDIELKFANQRCQIISDLFPNPFYVIPDEADPYRLAGTIWTLTELFSMLSLLMAFEGKVKLKE